MQPICRGIRKAHSLLKEAVRLDPKSIAAHSALASVLRLTEIKAALDEAQRVVEVAPRYSTGHVDVGRTLLTMDRKREAIEELRRAVRLKPEKSGSADRARRCVPQGEAVCQIHRGVSEGARLQIELRKSALWFVPHISGAWG